LEKELGFTYKQSFEKSISDDLKKKFQSDIIALENQGFSHFSMHQEEIWPFSLLFLFPVYLLMATNEYVQIKSPLRITSYHLIYISQEFSTLAYIYGMGCKFFTKFTDGTWVVSNTGQKIRDEKVLILKPDTSMISTQQIWKRHQGKVMELIGMGKVLYSPLTFDDWVEIENRFDQNNKLSLISMGISWMVLSTCAIIWITIYVLNLF
jgi:hypothetical protein